jgi:hypothetical protein
MTDDQEFIRNELRITCADAVELVTDYLDDALNQRDLDDFRTHLSLCEGCQVFLDQMKQTVTLVSHSRNTTVDLQPAKMDELLAALDAESKRPSEE